MLRNARGRGSLWILVVVVGCTPVERTTPSVGEVAASECTVTPEQPPLPVVTTVQTRDHEVTVHAGADGLRFTVSLAGGVLLGHQLTERQFEDSFPGLHQRYDSAFAGEQVGLDARLDLEQATPHGAAYPLASR